MTDFLHDILTSFKFRILGSIFLILFLALALVLYGVWTYQRDRLIDMTSRNAMEAGRTIEAGLRFSMLQNDRQASMEIIRNMLRHSPLTRISVLNRNCEVVMSSDPGLAGAVFDMNMEPTCLACHGKGPKKDRTVAIIDGNRHAFLRAAVVILNEPACFGCHPEEQRVNGVLLVDSSLADTRAMLAAIARRIVLIGVAALLVAALLVSYIVTRFFTRPLDCLRAGFEQVGRGDFSHWVEVDCAGEIAYMSDSFNIMSRAIGRYVTELKERSKEVTALYTIVQRMSLTIEKKKLKEVVTDLLGEILQVGCVVLVLPLEKRKTVFELVWVEKGDKRHYHAVYDIEAGPPAGRCRCPLAEGDLRGWLQRTYESPVFSDNNQMLLIPLQLNTMQLGLIHAVKPPGEQFTRQQRKIIPVLAHHITISFANARLYDLAVTDELTTLYTKRYFTKKINDFEENYAISKRGYGVLMIDLDHFKDVNDAFGHLVGDQVLARVAELIRATVRHGDVACRYGGEEFVVLLRGGDTSASLAIADRIRKKIAAFVFSINGLPPFSKTVSIGLACCPRHFIAADDVVAAADAALYEAKRSGRNRVAVFNPDPPQ